MDIKKVSSKRIEWEETEMEMWGVCMCDFLRIFYSSQRVGSVSIGYWIVAIALCLIDNGLVIDYQTIYSLALDKVKILKNHL